ncbi:fungal hydrophobin-domain-containing protein [Schizophyllum amplum]|uniref:Hydrophobin n=1 Tax=Schizophyllum amplum TaxID=97359 RepID=A0A550CQI2_9AGAR|nr:fungal hydrophobin-domain-containing protein [Auriculariopsis ampla]
MKLQSFIVFLFALFFVAQAVPMGETNAQRMSRGLAPLKPRNLGKGSAVEFARRAGPSSTPGSCSTGPVQCCNKVVKASNPAAGLLLGLLGIVLGDLNTLVGLTCSPISVIGAGGNSCSAQTVCCENNSFNGLINIGCSPISL